MTNQHSDVHQHPALQSARLCQACALCCNGALFSHVDVTPKEAESLAGSPLDIRPTKKGQNQFLQPCPALKDKCCSLYKDRPKTCQTYLCQLTKDVLNGAKSYDQAESIVAEFYTHMGRLLENSLVERLPLKAPKPIKANTPVDVLKAWAAKPEEPTPEKPSLGLWQILSDLYDDFDDRAKRGTLEEDDKAFILDAYEILQMVDRYFETTALLRKYAVLIQGMV